MGSQDRLTTSGCTQPSQAQCWEHGCNGRQFSTFSNLLAISGEIRTAAKATCPNCGARIYTYNCTKRPPWRTKSVSNGELVANQSLLESFGVHWSTGVLLEVFFGGVLGVKIRNIRLDATCIPELYRKTYSRF